MLIPIKEAFIDKLNQSLKLAIAALGSLGSTIIAVDETTGKRSLNVAPTVLVMYILSVAGCYFSHDEPFGQCVKTIVTSLGG